MRYFTTTLVLVCIFVGVLSVGHSEALVGLQPGVRAGYYEDADAFFIGADLKFDLLMFSANPSLEWAFPDGGDLLTLNFDGFMDFSIIPLISIWGGAGVAAIYTNSDLGGSSWDAGLNLLGGAGVDVLLDPYLYVKYIISDNNTWVFGVGIRF